MNISPPQRGRILVVDDDPNCTRALAALLRADGFEVSTASNGAQALDTMRERSHDAVVTDLTMPGMDGFELLKRVRDEFVDMLVVVVSGSTLSNVIPMIEGGALAYVAKPIQIDEVVSILDAGLQLRTESQRGGVGALQTALGAV